MRIKNIIKLLMAAFLIVASTDMNVVCGQNTISRSHSQKQNNVANKNKKERNNKGGSNQNNKSQPSPRYSRIPSNTHKKNILYSFSPGEIIYDCEYSSTRKFGSNNWMMVTTSPKIWRLIKNGKVVVSSKFWIGLDSYDSKTNKAIYYYRNEPEEYYVHVGDKISDHSPIFLI